LLAQHFLKQHVERYRKGITGFDAGAVEAMQGHAWPGNVRELDHAVERGVLMATGKVMTPFALTCAKSLTRFRSLFATLGVPLDLLAIS